VSILEVPIRFGSTSFQSNDVRGAQKSEFLFWNVSYKIRKDKPFQTYYYHYSKTNFQKVGMIHLLPRKLTEDF
jgi:hypothetical protein